MIPSELPQPPQPAQAATLLASKLRRPALPIDTLPRLAPLARLDAWQPGQQRLVMIAAPAGYGKTTLAVLWLQRLAAQYPALQSVWLALDPDDDGPVPFVRAVTAALSPFVPEAAAQVQGLLEQSTPPIRQAWQLLLAGLDEREAPLLLVLDDTHRLTNPEVHQLLQMAIERGPAQLHLLMLTRHAPPLAMGRLRAQRRLLELDTANLRLTRAEIEELLVAMGPAPFSKEQIDQLEERTEGWITGLLLLLLTHRPPADAQVILNRTRGDSEHLAAFLTEEVLAAQNPDMRAFLLDCSILTRMTPDLCVAVTERTESITLLRQAVEGRLFVRPLGSELHWYEFHHLFRDLLLHELNQQTTDAHRRTLHRRAAEWFLAAGELTPALHHLAAARDHERAADLVAEAARPAVLRNDFHTLKTWVAILPEATVNSRPQLLVDLAWAALHSGGDNLIQAFERVQNQLANMPPPPAALQDEINALQLWVRAITTSQEGIFHDAVELLNRLGRNSYLARGWSQMAVIANAGRKPQSTVVYPELQQAYEAFGAAGYSQGQVLALSFQGIIEFRQGRGTAALSTCERGLAMIATIPKVALHELYELHFTAGETLYLMDRVAEAEKHFAEALAILQLLDNPAMCVRATCWLQMCNHARNQRFIPTPQQRLEEKHLSERALATQAVYNQTQMIEAQMRRWLAMNRRDRAWQAFEQLNRPLRAISSEMPDYLLRCIFIAWIVSPQQVDEIVPFANDYFERAERSDRLYDMLEVALWTTLYYQRIGQYSTARAHLRRALEYAETSGYKRMLLDARPILPLLRSERSAFARALADKIEENLARSTMQGGVDNSLSRQEMTILRLMADGRNNREIAEHLLLSEGTVRWHLTRLYARLGARNRNQALALAHEQGLL